MNRSSTLKSDFFNETFLMIFYILLEQNFRANWPMLYQYFASSLSPVVCRAYKITIKVFSLEIGMFFKENPATYYVLKMDWYRLVPISDWRKGLKSVAFSFEGFWKIFSLYILIFGYFPVQLWLALKQLMNGL